MQSRRRILQFLATLPACDAGSREPTLRAGLAESAAPDAERPDIVFISIDDLNDWPTPFVGPKPTFESNQVHTPNIDRLASWGTVFQRAYCAAPMCGPSRSATLTGLPPHVSGVTHQEDIFAPFIDKFGPLLEEPKTTLPRLLRASGYRTYGAGKVFHYTSSAATTFAEPLDPAGCADPPGQGHRIDACGWDEFQMVDREQVAKDCKKPPKGAPIDEQATPCTDGLDLDTSFLPDVAVARYGVERIAEAQESGAADPMFLALGFFKPHIPWRAPQEFYDLYPIETIIPNDPAVEQADQDDLTLTGCVTLRDARNSPEDWDKGTREAVRGYLACVSYVDHLLGEVLDAIETSSRRTTIILWSDHGYFMGEKRGWKKPSLYERAAKIPLIIADTADLAPRETFGLASLMDLLPTVLDYAAVEDPLGYGVSLRPLVHQPSGPWSQTSVVTTFNFKGDMTRKTNETFNPDVDRCMKQQDVAACGPFVLACPLHANRLAGASAALRTERYRFIRYYDVPGFDTKHGPLPTEELYDLENDPLERTNLLAPGADPSEASQAVAASLRAELLSKLA